MTNRSSLRWHHGLAPALLAAALLAPATAQERVRSGDWIAAVVNQELVTAGEVQRRTQRAQAEASRNGMNLPPEAELRRQVLDMLINERAMISSAREMGMRVDDADVNRAIQSIATQNQLQLPELLQRLEAEGLDFGRFRADIREQIMIERLREREVYRRIDIKEEDIDKFLADRRAAAQAQGQLNVAQILITVPDGADAATVESRRARAMTALTRVRGGEAFDAVARELSEDGNRERGGEIGLRPADRLPDLFVEGVSALQPGQINEQPLRSGAGFHVLKLLERQAPAIDRVTQTRVRHVLLRTSQQVSAEMAARQLAQYRSQIFSGGATFEDIARRHSEDGSAPNGGDLGWASPGMFVPEFEEAMNELPLGGVSQPVASRFGVHLIQVLERRETAIEQRQLREQARNVLREQRFEQAYEDWTKELRSRAYVEFREPPQ